MANLVEGFQSIEWSDYQAASSKGQIASGILVVITVIALAVIFATHPQSAYLKANLTGIITLAATGGIALVTLIACTTLNFYAMRKMDEKKQTQVGIQELLGVKPDKSDSKKGEESPKVEHPVVIKTDIKTDPIGHAQEVLLNPLWDQLEDVVKAVVAAHGMSMSQNIGGRKEEIEKTFKAGKELFNSLLNNPQIYLTELLGFFGGRKIPMSVALRRLIAAKNSGDDKKFKEVLETYQAVISGYDLNDIIDLFHSNISNEKLMEELPGKLETHFCLTDHELKKMGMNVLKHIFTQTKNNTEISNQLTTLRKITNKETFSKELEKFVKLVFEKANVSPQQMKGWNDELIKYMLDTQFTETTCSLLKVFARNIRILKLMFDKKQNEKKLFIELDTIFLLSESNECILKKDLQEDLLKVQSEINQNRKEQNRIALIALKKDDGRNYETLKEQEVVIKYCFEANAGNKEELEKVNKDARVTKLGQNHQVRIIAVPISISDHPFKIVKKHEKMIRYGTGFLQAVTPKDYIKNKLLEKVKPKLLQALPKLEDNNLVRLNSLTDGLFNFLIDPIIDGAIKNTPFRTHFERIITTEGEELATELEKLALKKDLALKDISPVATKAIGGLTKEFKKVARGEK